MTMRLSIIIVSYNTCDMTRACLESVYEQALSDDFEVIVVDNASDDGSAEMVRQSFPHAVLRAEKVNHGFAAGNNIAAGMARGDYLLLLNPDTVVLDHALDRLVAFAESAPQAGIWGGRTIFADGSLNPTSCWRRPTPWNLFCRAVGLSALFPGSAILNSESYGGWRRDSVRHVDIVTGCLFLIRREMWERLGGFSPDFFMYGEEADLCLRARKAGCRPMITPDATIVHYGGASEKTRVGKLVKLFAAKMEIVRRHWRAPLRPLGTGLMALFVLVRVAGFGLAAGLFRGGRFGDQASAWRDVWRRRASWLRGYPAGSGGGPPSGEAAEG